MREKYVDRFKLFKKYIPAIYEARTSSLNNFLSAYLADKQYYITTYDTYVRSRDLYTYI